MKRIYLDNAATTKVDPRVLNLMKKFFTDKYGNPNSLHSFGIEAREAIEISREKIANLINANSNEIIFTSGGTESNNLAIKGIAFANKSKGKHIIVSSIEHHCVLETVHWLEKNGFKISFLDVDKYGVVNIEKLKSLIRRDTILVSIMHANNEIGTIEPIKEIGEICKDYNILFHTDAVQSFGKIEIDVKKYNIDLLSASSHKIHGPKGVGCLYIKEGTKIEPILHGGGQEFGIRSGTENVPGIVGFGKAAEICKKEMKNEKRRIEKMRDKLINNILNIENTRLNGHPKIRLPNNVNCSFEFIEGEALIGILNEFGIAASTGSACSSRSLKPSHVLLAIGLSPEIAHGSLRLTLGRFNTEKEIDYVIKKIPEAVEKLRNLSPYKKRW
ncbi:MAG: cysteine desulfurase NifS [Candidatus Aenigmatarchaeota archaeon]|nr:cysteine desulfurase NifS [Candidatus Aenigmarchaeota archaeon]